MNITKAQSNVLSETTKGAISPQAFYRLKGKDIFRVAHSMQADDLVSIRIDQLVGWDKETDKPEWEKQFSDGKLPRGTKPCFAFRCSDVEYKPRANEHVVLVGLDDDENLTARPATVQQFTRGKVNCAVWNEEGATEEIIKAKLEDVLVLVGFARDYVVNQQLFNLMTDKQSYALSIDNVEQTVNVLDSYELTVYDWLDYATAENPRKTVLYRYYVKPQEIEEDNGVLWTFFEEGAKLKAKYQKRHLTVNEVVDFETTVHNASQSKLKEVYAKVCEKSKVADEDKKEKIADIKAHLIELCNTDKKQSIAITLLTK